MMRMRMMTMKRTMIMMKTKTITSNQNHPKKIPKLRPNRLISQVKRSRI